jgi:hypothetical protein
MISNIEDSSNDNNISIEIYYNNNSVQNVFSAEVDDIISFNFSSNNSHIKFGVLISCDNIYFSSCEDSQNFSPELLNETNNIINLKDVNHQINVNCSYQSINSSEIIFKFPNLSYYFPSSIIELNIQSNTFQIDNLTNFNRTINQSLTSSFENGRVYNNIENIIYQNFENKDEWFYITENDIKRVIYFKNLCDNFINSTKGNEIFYKCEKSKINCEEIKSIIKSLKIESEIKCDNNNYLNYHYYNISDEEDKNKNWKKCVDINHYLNNTLEYFLIERNDTHFNLSSNYSVDINCSNYTTLCNKQLELINKNDKITFYCESNENCDNNIKEIFQNFINLDVEIHCENNITFLIRTYEYKYNISNLESWEYCAYIHQLMNPEIKLFKIDNNNNGVYLNGEGELQNEYCNLTYLINCTELNKTINNSKINLSCRTNLSSSNAESYFSSKLSNDKLEINIICNDGFTLIYHNYDNTILSSNDEKWKICCRNNYIYKNQSVNYFRIKIYSYSYSVYSVYYYDDNKKYWYFIGGYLVDICNSFLLNCHNINFYDMNEISSFVYSTFITHCETNLSCDEIKNQLINNKILYSDIIVNCENNKEIRYHYYRNFNNEKMDLCLLNMGLTKNISHYIIEFEDKSDHNNYIINDFSNNNLNSNYSNYFEYCDLELSHKKRGNYSYLFCHSSKYNCNDIIQLITKLTSYLDYEIVCEDLVINFHNNSHYNYYTSDPNWVICSKILYLNSKKNSFYKIIRKQNDTSLNNSFSIFNEYGTIEFDLSICQYPFLYFCNNGLIWEPRSNNIQCKINYGSSSTIKTYFNLNSTEMDFIVSGDYCCYYYLNNRCTFLNFSYHNYNNFNRTDDEDWKKCCVI